MGIFYSLKKMNRMVDASEVIRRQIDRSNPGIFSGDFGKFSDYAVKCAERKWDGLLQALKKFDFLPNAQVWATCGVATIVSDKVGPRGLLRETKFTVGHDFALVLLARLIEEIDMDHRLKSTLSALEVELLTEAIKIQDSALQELDHQ